ncbi:Zn-ribbon domain-containing OB-fold protein, partial [Mycolicibacterium vanbaalenii]
MSTSAQPAIDGWFATDGRAVDSGPDGRAVDSGPDGRAVDSATDGSGDPYLIGGKCHECGTFVFPPRANNCPNPGCGGDELAQVPLSRRGTLWSYTENRYAPPPPYPSPDPF